MKTNTLSSRLDAITRDKKLTWEQRVAERQALVRASLKAPAPEVAARIWKCWGRREGTGNQHVWVGGGNRQIVPTGSGYTVFELVAVATVDTIEEAKLTP